MNSYPLLGHDGAALLCYFFSDPFFPRGPSWFFPASTRKGTTPLLLFCFLLPGGFGAEPGQVQQGSGEGSGEGLGGFGAEPGQGSGEGSGEGSGRLWCRAGSGSTGIRRRSRRRFQEALVQNQVRFNGVRKRFRRRPGRLWCRARSGSTGFWRRFRRRSGSLWRRARLGSTGFRRRFWEALVQSQVRVPEKVLEKVPGGFGAEPGQVQQGSGEGPGEGSRKPWCKTKWGSTGSVKGSGEGLGGFGAEPGQVQQGSGEGSGEGSWEALAQSQVRFNRIPEKVPEKVPGGFGAEPGQVQQGSGEGPGEGSPGSLGAKPSEVQRGP